MAARRDSADREIDLHGYTSVAARARLNTEWSTRKWHGLQRVRIIHGTGSVLHALVRLWCEEKGLAWTIESHNPGVTILHPGRRLQADPAPPHRPLNSLNRHLPIVKPKPRQTERRANEGILPADQEGDGLSDEERMQQEFDSLASQESAAMLLKKRSTDPGSPNPGAKKPRPTKPTLPNIQPSIGRSPTPGDPMAAEFDRLDADNSLTLFKRKRELLPPRQFPAKEDSDCRPLSASTQQPCPNDLMAEEFARLAQEQPQITRNRKGSRL